MAVSFIASAEGEKAEKMRIRHIRRLDELCLGVILPPSAPCGLPMGVRAVGEIVARADRPNPWILLAVYYAGDASLSVVSCNICKLGAA